MAKPISEKYKERIADSNVFPQVVSILKGVFTKHRIEVNHYKKSFSTKNAVSDGEILPIEGILQPGGEVKVTICIATIFPPAQIPAIPFWDHLSELEHVEILPLVSNSNGSQSFWIGITIHPGHLNFIKQPRLQKTLEEIKGLADFLKESISAAQSPDITKMIDLYDKISYQFVKPLEKKGLVLPSISKIADSIYPSLISGNPVIIKHPSPLILEYVVSALATQVWQNFHFGLLRYLLPYGLFLESIDKVPGIPVIPLDMLLMDNTGFNLNLCYKAIYQTGRPVLFLCNDMESSHAEYFNAYSIKEEVPLSEILFNCLFQFSNDLSIKRIQKLAAEAIDIIQPFYSEYEKEITHYLPSFCRLLLHLHQNDPSQIRNKLRANLFHHFE